MRNIGKYEVVEKIGEGGFGVIFKGFDPHIRRFVAIKSCTSEEQDIRNRFFHEAQIAGNLQHRHIVTVYDFGLQDGVPYLVQEYLSGEDLDRKVKRKDASRSPREAALPDPGRARPRVRPLQGRHPPRHQARPTSASSRTARRRSWTSASPSSTNQDTGLTQTGMTLGTAAYLAPEQIRGEAIGPATDIFSWGVTAYELLAYRRPFAGQHISTVLYQILNERRRRCATRRPTARRVVADHRPLPGEEAGAPLRRLRRAAARPRPRDPGAAGHAAERARGARRGVTRPRWPRRGPSARAAPREGARTAPIATAAAPAGARRLRPRGHRATCAARRTRSAPRRRCGAAASRGAPGWRRSRGVLLLAGLGWWLVQRCARGAASATRRQRATLSRRRCRGWRSPRPSRRQRCRRATPPRRRRRRPPRRRRRRPTPPPRPSYLVVPAAWSPDVWVTVGRQRRRLDREQRFAVTPGTSTKVSFEYAGDGYGDSAQSSVRVAEGKTTDGRRPARRRRPHPGAAEGGHADRARRARRRRPRHADRAAARRKAGAHQLRIEPSDAGGSADRRSRSSCRRQEARAHLRPRLGPLHAGSTARCRPPDSIAALMRSDHRARRRGGRPRSPRSSPRSSLCRSVRRRRCSARSRPRSRRGRQPCRARRSASRRRRRHRSAADRRGTAPQPGRPSSSRPRRSTPPATSRAPRRSTASSPSPPPAPPERLRLLVAAAWLEHQLGARRRRLRPAAPGAHRPPRLPVPGAELQPGVRRPLPQGPRARRRRPPRSAPTSWCSAACARSPPTTCTRARATLVQALALAPDDPFGLFNLALVEMKAGHRDQAIAGFERLLVVEAGRPGARAAARCAAPGARQPRPALLREGLPRGRPALPRAGDGARPGQLAHLEQPRADPAQAWATPPAPSAPSARRLELAPDDPQVANNLALLVHRRAALEPTRWPLLAGATRAAPDDAAAWLNLGLAQRGAGDRAAAARRARARPDARRRRTSWGWRPAPPPTWRSCATSRATAPARRPRRGRRSPGGPTTSTPGSTSASRSRLQGDFAGARDSFQRAAARSTRRGAEIHNNLGTALVALGDLAGAEAAFRQALAIRPGFPEAQANLDQVAGAAGRCSATERPASSATPTAAARGGAAQAARRALRRGRLHLPGHPGRRRRVGRRQTARPAEAGLREGDVVLGVDGKPIDGPQQLLRYIYAPRRGKPTTSSSTSCATAARAACGSTSFERRTETPPRRRHPPPASGPDGPPRGRAARSPASLLAWRCALPDPRGLALLRRLRRSTRRCACSTRASKLVQATLPLLGWWALGMERRPALRGAPRRGRRGRPAGAAAGAASAPLPGRARSPAWQALANRSPRAGLGTARRPRRGDARCASSSSRSASAWSHSLFEEYYWRWFALRPAASCGCRCAAALAARQPRLRRPPLDRRRQLPRRRPPLDRDPAAHARRGRRRRRCGPGSSTATARCCRPGCRHLLVDAAMMPSATGWSGARRAGASAARSQRRAGARHAFSPAAAAGRAPAACPPRSAA